MSQTSTRPRTELVLAIPPPARYIHTRWPSPASLVANTAAGLAILDATVALAGGFTGRLDVESPVLLALIALLYALATVAWVARSYAERNDVSREGLL